MKHLSLMLVVGRDNPGTAVWYDNHQGIYDTCGGHKANNHPDMVNVLYLAGVGHDSLNIGITFEPPATLPVKNNSNGTWAFLDRITY